jgi:FKBP-type peptidyl-prolyl cis-trans isomerase FkpA
LPTLLSLLLLTGLLAACNQPAAPEKETVKKPETDVDKQSYALGAIFSSRVRQDVDKIDGLEVNKEMMIQGFIDGMNDKTLMTEEELQAEMMAYQQRVQQQMEKSMSAKAEGNKKAGQEFLAKEMAADATIKASESGSGLYYKVIQEGDGKNFPAATDTVKVHYVGTFIDGNQFDSSIDRGEPIEFPLNRVIQGWTEGLQLMSKGAKYKFYIPSDIAYGDPGRGQIKPGDLLVFEVELLDIIKPTATEEK